MTPGIYAMGCTEDYKKIYDVRHPYYHARKKIVFFVTDVNDENFGSIYVNGRLFDRNERKIIVGAAVSADANKTNVSMTNEQGDQVVSFAIGAATDKQAGLLSAEDKAKLDQLVIGGGGSGDGGAASVVVYIDTMSNQKIWDAISTNGAFIYFVVTGGRTHSALVSCGGPEEYSIIYLHDDGMYSVKINRKTWADDSVTYEREDNYVTITT